MASTMVVTNNSGAALTIYGQVIDNNAFYSFTSDQIAGVCADVIFRLAMLQNQLVVVYNGVTLSLTLSNTVAFIQYLAEGSITP